MKKAAKCFYSFLDKLCFSFITVAFAAIVVILGAQIALRMIFKAPTMWAEEVCRYLFLWLLFIGGGIAFSKGGHLMVDVLFAKLPKKLQLILTFVYYIVIIGFSGYLAYSGMLYALSQWARPMYTVAWMKLGVVDLCIPIGSVISILYILRELYYMVTRKEEYLENKGGALG